MILPLLCTPALTNDNDSFDTVPPSAMEIPDVCDNPVAADTSHFQSDVLHYADDTVKTKTFEYNFPSYAFLWAWMTCFYACCISGHKN